MMDATDDRMAKLREQVAALPTETSEPYGEPFTFWWGSEPQKATYVRRQRGADHFRKRVLALIDEALA